MTPQEQHIFERIIKLETEQAHLTLNFNGLKTDIDLRFTKLEETLKSNQKETRDSLLELKETLVMGKGITKFVGWIVGAFMLVVAILKYFKP